MPKIKLTDADVRGLRYARNVEGASLAFLANAYRVSKAQVSRVTRGLQHKINEKPTSTDLEDFRAARKLLEAKDVPVHPDAQYATTAAEVSSDEETPEVSKWVRNEWEGSDVVSYTIQDKTSEVGKWSDEEKEFWDWF